MAKRTVEDCPDLDEMERIFNDAGGRSFQNKGPAEGEVMVTGVWQVNMNLLPSQFLI